MKYVIGLDIGGTKIHSIVMGWDENFLRTRKLSKIVKSRRVAVENKKNAAKFFKEIVSEIDALISEFGKKNIERIGIGIAGPLSKDKTLLNPPNLPFKNFKIRKRLKENFKIPIYVDNDANCFAWAEHLFGAAHEASSTAGITLGTGVGGGIVLECNGESFLWSGYYGGAAEVGHMILDASTGSAQVARSFEDLCSSRAKHLWNGSDPLSIENKARGGDKKSRDVYKEFGFWLGVGIANIINVVEPQVVVVGGSLSNAWDLFEGEMRRVARKYIESSRAKDTKIVRAKLKDEAGAIGAAYLIS